jgi:acetylglutamate kinase
MTLSLLTTTGLKTAVDATARAAASALVAGQLYAFTTTGNCWIRQGTSQLITCVIKANLVDTDFFTIAVDGVTKVYEFDTVGNGVTVGRVQVNVSTDTTAAQVAARLRTAILANQSTLEVTDNTDGTLTVVRPDGIATFTENVANGTFAIAAAVMTVSAANGSTLVAAGVGPTLNGSHGPQVGVIQDGASTGTCCVTRYRMV